MKNKHFTNFLTQLESQSNKPLIEAVRKAYKICFEDADQLETQQQSPKIRISYETWDEESIDIGETDDKGWLNEEGVDMTPDQYDLEEGLTAVDLAVKFLKDEGADSASNSSGGTGTWYTNYGSMETDGTTTNQSYFLIGFTPEQEEEIFQKMN